MSEFLSESDIIDDNKYLVLMDTNEAKNQTEQYGETHLKDDDCELVEYIVPDNEFRSELIDSNYSLSSHTLYITEGCNNSFDKLYNCIECNASYATIEQFSAMHPSNEDTTEEYETSEQLWQAIDTDDEATLAGESGVKGDGKSGQMTETVEEQLWLENDETIPEAENESQKYFCYDCQSVFDDLPSAEQHECGNVSTKPLRARNTAMPVNKQQREKHIESVTCSICKTVFDNQKNLRFHMRIHNKPELKSIQDAIPAAALQQYNELNQFYCEICNRSFNQNLLAVHKNMHQNVEEYTCGVCNRKFENKSSYEMHVKLHADKKQKVEKETASAASNLQQSSTGRAPYPCQYCGRSFGRPYEKVKHERVHTGEKPYECEVCGKTFRVSYSLTLHLRTHTDIRPYTCTTCNKRFKSYQVYSHHLRIHSTDRPYTCDICSKSFRTSVQLYAHKNSHTKPFNCPECNRPFASLYSVKLHMKTHSKGAKGKSNDNQPRCFCYVCGAEYTRNFALRFHLRDVHGIEVQQDIKLESKSGAHFAEEEVALEAASDEAILIAAATQADDYALQAAAVNELDDLAVTTSSPTYMAGEVITETTLNQDAFSVDSFATEEVITDWIVK